MAKSDAPPLLGCAESTKFGSKAGKVGLKNLGNTCFMNTGLQCLAHIEPLAAHFLNGDFKQEMGSKTQKKGKGELAKTFADLIRTIWQSEKPVYDPRTFRQMLKRTAPHLMDSDEQQDVQEFLAFCIDGLHEDLSRISKAPPPLSEDQEKEDETLQQREGDDFGAALAWLRHLERERSFLVDLLQGQLRSTLTCRTCGHTSRRYDPFLYLSLPVAKNMSQVTDALSKYLEPEELTGDERWHCDSCKKKVDATKKIDLWNLPAVLVLHLKRFEFDAKNQQFQKTDNRLNMKLHDVDLSSFCSSEQRDGASYSVACVANHSGSYEDGHYTATCKVGNKGAWHHFSDSQVKAHSGRGVVTKETYVIFLVRNQLNSDGSRIQPARSQKQPIKLRRQDLMKPEDWPHPEESVAAVLNATTGRRSADVTPPKDKDSPPRAANAKASRASMAKTTPSRAKISPKASPKAANEESKQASSEPQKPAPAVPKQTVIQQLLKGITKQSEKPLAATPDAKRKAEGESSVSSDVAASPRPVKQQRTLDSLFHNVPLRGSTPILN
mmetsp:Transcript_90094/g.160448  ORF Transcript_90094/g.160448 Transcript_90094/m.160448 type:complete len:552 (-) Transcript_90094:61-1716(-)|eukprot:CAMPEP_0197621962 /NCGR_PEP_ID=MMETSP1338-20131121/2374_1 /TAXON_ID=43686 ORGANISM="Pelagodinium beii, Strain RCC1491" /NCGR_SAMPLE_ID=MMETSP1338 /ASSEMBLY_ACC=CAM_ASM_000754 /LENGTH=551 /DNA_ID=CAMNT_0043191547 /DNA_START=48 /DNA_END=1703 /DNA_ORIENTATION=-